jgi:hypothetical protein
VLFSMVDAVFDFAMGGLHHPQKPHRRVLIYTIVFRAAIVGCTSSTFAMFHFTENLMMLMMKWDPLTGCREVVCLLFVVKNQVLARRSLLVAVSVFSLHNVFAFYALFSIFST